MTEPKKPMPDPQVWNDADLPILTDVDNDPAAADVDIPEFDFSDELDKIANALDTPTEAPLEFPPELLLDDVIDGAAATGEGAIDFNLLPSLDLDGEAAPDGSEFEFELEPVAAMAHDAAKLDTLAAHAEFDAVEPEASSELPTGMPAEFDTQIPELRLDDVLPGPSSADMLSPETPTPELASQLSAIPELMLDDVLEDTAEPEATLPAASLEEQAVAFVGEPQLDELPVLDEVGSEPSMVPQLEEPVAGEVVESSLDDLPVLQEEQSEPVMAAAPEEPEAATVVPSLDDLPVLQEEQPDPVMAAVPEEPETATVVPSLDDLPVLQGEQSEPVMDAMQEEMPADALSVSGAEPALAAGESFRSISLDSLPRGVLGGGRALAEAEAEDSAPSVQDLIRAAERTLAQEQLKQARAESMPAPLLDTPTPARALPSHTEQPAGAAARPVEIINVAGLASSPAPQSFNLPPVRKSYVTLVDEVMLIDSLYDKILPRMKVELSLWLQDALDHQSKQMLSGVMHQLKEDYEMLFSETLRESLRQAIAEMGREDRGERY